MTEQHDVLAERLFKKLDEKADIGAGYTGLLIGLAVEGLTVLELAEAKALQIPAIAVTTEDGSAAWMLVQYAKKPKKGSKAKAKIGYWSEAHKKLVDCPFVDDKAAPFAGKFHKGGWPFPLRCFLSVSYL